MAGICGIAYIKKNKSEKAMFPIEKMADKLKYSANQQSEVYKEEYAVLANVIPVSKKNNDRFIFNKELGIICAIDGYMHVDHEVIKRVKNLYVLEENLSEYELLPYLYKSYKEELSLHLTGSYNVFVYEVTTSKWLLTNDRFGYYPLYYFKDNEKLVFGSKIECILASDTLTKIEFDRVSIAEHLYFRYILSEHTYINKIKSLPNASYITNISGDIEVNKYWDIRELFDEPTIKDKESFELFDSSLKEAIIRCLPPVDETINLSLTGGWDCRTVLAYLLPDHRDKVNLYSYGTENSGDVSIPLYISQKESMQYMPFVFDDNYYNNIFPMYAEKNSLLSSGTRNYQLTHYVYIMEFLSNYSDQIITGIFGDDIFKGGGRLGTMGTLSPNIQNLIENDFSYEMMIDHFYMSEASKVLDSLDSTFKEKFASRIEELRNYYQDFATYSERYTSFRVERSLRKHFGNEANSYNDFVYCYSPFIDYEFYKNYSRTKFATFRYDFECNTFKRSKLRLRSLNLYTDLVLKHYKPLAYYPSGKGYKMADTKRVPGMIKIYYKKFINKEDIGTDKNYIVSSDNQFKKILKSERAYIDDLLNVDDIDRYDTVNADALSLKYWIGHICRQYL